MSGGLLPILAHRSKAREGGVNPLQTKHLPTTGRNARDETPPGTVATAQVRQEPFLDLVVGMKAAIDILAKSMESQRRLLLSLLHENRTSWTPVTSPTPKFPWLSSLNIQ